MFLSDYVFNGRGHGDVGEVVASCRFDPGLLRPYVDDRGHKCCTVNTGRRRYNPHTKATEPVYEKVRVADLIANGIYSPVFNATSLRKEEWIELDRVVLRSARFRLRAWADLAAANSFGGFNGMSKMILEHETMNDPGEAVVDMDGLTEGRTDSPKFQLEGLPLPITHSDFWFSARRLAVSRNSGTPLDTTMGEAAGRRVAEKVEKTLIGVETGVTYGGNSTQVGGYGRTSSVYGYLNFPNRLTKTNLTAPTAGSWTPAKTLADVLAMRDLLYLNKFYGPFMLYHSNDWDQYMDNDYILTGGNVATQTLRERLKAIEGISDVRRLDFLTAAVTAAGDPADIQTSHPFTLILVQMTPDVARAINGMDITTVQWESIGGMRLNFKVLCLAGHTKVQQRNGSTPTIKSLAGSGVEIKNRFGSWERGTVQSFGTQRLFRINFAHLSPVYATADHQWWMRDGTRVSTTSLKSVPFTDESYDAEVVSIEDTGRDEEVFCAVVPESQSFTLANGLTTSNCIQVPQLRADFQGNSGICQGTTS